MICDIPIIKPFIIKKECYVYDTYTNKILSLSHEQYQAVSSLLKNGVSKFKSNPQKSEAEKDIVSLMDSGFFRCAFINEIKHTESDIIPYILDNGIVYIQLQVTKSCNFKCRYCIFANNTGITRTHETEYMSFDIAEKSVDFLYYHSKDSQKVNISFYGGEPLLNFKTIKHTVEYASNKFFSKNIVYHTTTNGALLNDYIVDFFAKHDFRLTISFDGSEKIQNSHRRFSNNGEETYDIVYKNVLYIMQNYPEYFEKYVSFNSVLFYDESKNDVVEYFCGLGIPEYKVRVSYADISGIDYLYNIDIYNVIQRKKQETFANKNDIETLVTMKNTLMDSTILPESWHHNGPCIPGTSRLFIDTKGQFYPCEKVLEVPDLVIGNIVHGFYHDKIINFTNIGKITENECRNCWMIRFCSICLLHCTNPEKGEVSRETKLNECKRKKHETELYLKKTVEYISNDSTI